MKTPVAALAVLLLLPGCGGKDGDDPPPASAEFLVDAAGDAAPNYDILSGQLFELNGSIVLRLRVANYNTSNGGLPFFEARFFLDDGPRAYARADLPPCTSENRLPCGEAGRLVDGVHADAYTTCWFPSFPPQDESREPWWLLIEVLHNRSGLADGGRVDRLEVDTFDANDTVRDHAEVVGSFPVRGGPNPYANASPSCPLLQERQSVLKTTGPTT